MKRKLLLMTAMIIILSSICTTIYAAGNNVFQYGEDYVIFPSDSVLSEAQKQKIADTIMNEGDHLITHYGLSCILFGHDYETEYPTVIRHRVYASNPRCVSERYETKMCTKCDDVVSTQISAMRTECCD